ncbi:hypothetical protein BDN72DRAFT_893153 [Pluteus cervinus]|uniref:Uncharacterized protein n=1 Tax=Pluteus cervinus TaxID=181527 RepID=A0ACD3BBU3_9AGAR|nr:hypothetical protein BDN72DRAFT_893153 [Pluteus cervinus]
MAQPVYDDVNTKPVPPGSAVEQLLNAYDDNYETFITHLDSHPIWMKVTAFIPTFLMHAFMAFMMVWRVYSGTARYSFIPAYFGELVMTKTAMRDPWYKLIIHAGIDYIVFNFFPGRVKWFLTGHFWLRLRYGFKGKEVVFRKPTGWRRALINGLPPDQRMREFFGSIYRAIDPSLLAQNVGFNTRSDFWVLEYAAVCGAYDAANRGEIDIENWKLKVWIKENGRWCVWEAWRAQDTNVSTRTFQIFKEKLEAMGRHDVIEKLPQFVQQHLAGPDGVARISSIEQIELMKQFFAQEGIDMQSLYTEANRELVNRDASGANVAQPRETPPPVQPLQPTQLPVPPIQSVQPPTPVQPVPTPPPEVQA